MLEQLLKKLEDQSVCVSLLLTERCNFACGHCMYECGPKRPKRYMSHGVLNAVRDQFDVLLEHKIYPEINLIGGEPTLDMNEFKRVLEHVSKWNNRIEMVTNGWWLASVPAATRFFETVAPYVNEDGTPDEGLCVRISNDPYHARFRPDRIQGRLKEVLAGALDDYNRDSEQWVCPECGRVARGYRERCSRCNTYNEPQEGEHGLLPEPHAGYPWIHVDQYWAGKPIANGRAASFGEASRYCSVDGLSFLPDGRMMDVCGMGSWCEFGTVNDNPLVLLALAQAFKQEMHPTCYTCRQDAKKWAKKNLAKLKAKLEQEYEELEL